MPFRHRSIALRLPLGMAALLVSACGILTAAAYLQVRQSAFAVANGRLEFAAHQVQSLLTTALRTRIQMLQKFAAADELRSYVSSPTQAQANALIATLSRFPGDSGRVAWRITDRSNSTLLTTANWRSDASDAGTTSAILAASPGVSLFQQTTDKQYSFYDITTPIKQRESSIGWIIERHWMTAAAPSLPVLEGLIGSQARVFIGNASGSFWTDFVKPIPALPSHVATALVEYPLAEGDFIARGAVVDGAPWVVATGLPLAPIVAPVHRFLFGATLVSVLVAGIGTLIAWRVGRRITMPLAEVAKSAEAIAPQGLPDDSMLRQGDEVARLTASFNAMATRVQQSQAALEALVNELESRVTSRTAELENANQELQAFSYSVSHDLRAPVRAISGFIRILIEERGHELSDDSRRYLEVVTRRTKQMGQLIDDLLSLSQVGRRRIEREPIDMNRLMSEVADEVRATEPGRRVEFEFATVPTAAGESSLVRQALTNLLQNALKFTRMRPDARIEAGSLVMDGEVVYFVRDNGVGFEMQYASRMFDAFHRLHATEEFEGTGVGLAIVERIITKHGGRVWAESAEGRGATFYFTLTARQREAA